MHSLKVNYVSAITLTPRFCVLNLFFLLIKASHSGEYTVVGDMMRGQIISTAVLSSRTCGKTQKSMEDTLPLFHNNCKAVPSVPPK